MRRRLKGFFKITALLFLFPLLGLTWFVFSRLDAPTDHHLPWLDEAAKAALEAGAKGDFPVGAVVVKEEKLLGTGRGGTRFERDLSLHAEIKAMNDASKNAGMLALRGANLYTTYEPCTMCRGMAQ
jgi:tRNA(adenine34) deaminase